MNGPVQARPTSFPLCALARSGLADNRGDWSPAIGDPRRHFLPLILPLLLLFFLTSLAPSSVVSAPLSSFPNLLASSACNPITSHTTWTSGVYTAENCNILVPAGVTLTIQAGAVVKLGGVSPGYGSGPGSAALIVQGGLVAAGDSGEPVAFTSLADDSRGGDSNANGPSSGAAGDWYGIVFAPGSRGRLENFFVGYAGSGAFNATLGYNSAQILVDSADVEMRQGEVVGGLQTGISLKGESIAPVLAQMTVRDNRMTNGRGYAIYQATINQNPAYSNLTLTGNDHNRVTVAVNDAIVQDIHWGGAEYGFVCGYTLCLMTVPNGKTLTVAPGTTLRFDPAYGIAIADGGALIAQGTASQSITFTSTSAPARAGGEWMGLWAQRGSQLRLDRCDISYANDTNFGSGGLEINTDDAQVRACHIHHNAGDGLYIYSRDGSAIHPQLTNVDVTDNGATGLHLQTSYGSTTSITWDGGSISRNGWSGVADYTTSSSIYPTFRNVAISANGSLGDNAERKRGISFRYHSVHPVLENVTLSDNAGTAISWYCNGSITARGLTATGNGADELEIPGCSVGSGRQWDLGDAGLPVRVTGDIEIPNGGLLTLQPGTSLAFDKNIYGSPTLLRVKDNAALYALGTADKPVVFTGFTQTPGWWAGVDVSYDRASVIFQHCEIAYGGGGGNPASLYLHGHSGVSPSPVQVQNCEIHNSARKGLHFDWVWTQPPLLRNNSIHDNAEEGVTNWNAPALDARNNWWGDATGPFHPTTNPGGKGENVGDAVIFYPWLAAPPTGEVPPGQMLVSTGGPSLISPGQTVDYAIQYLNGMTTTVTDAVLAVQLPQGAAFVDSPDGAFWVEKNQVFWLLGDLTPGSQGFRSFRVRFQWGLPADYKDGTLTLFAGSNYNTGQFDVSEYLAYTPVTLLSETPLGPAEFAALRALHPDLETLYSQAIGAGYAYLQAGRQAYSDASTVVWAAMRTADRRAVRLLTQTGEQSLAITAKDGIFSLHDSSGGLTIDLATQSRDYWGDWIPSDDQTDRASAACSKSKCIANCSGRKITFKVVTVAIGQTLLWTLGSGGTMGPGAVAFHVAHVSKMVYDCVKECDNPSTNCCADGQVRWSPSGWASFFGVPGCVKEECVGNSFVNKGTIYCAFGQRCVAGIDAAGGCKDCDAAGSQYRAVALAPASDPAVCASGLNAGSDCTETGVLRAKDPNAIYGPAGDLLPGQTVSYTVTYENEGAGRAYGVYVANDLPPAFDERTLNLHGKGVYLAESREIVWSVGELGPKGAVDSQGSVTYTVALTGGLPSGTVVSNQALVYFPSVPEETPTNTWVNSVSPLAALPQQMETGYMTPFPITLSGREVSNLPLTYEVVEQPHGGALSGSAPNLTYTPGENFTGADSFTFRVSNGASTSRAAAIGITVTPAGDTTAPTVLWSQPPANAVDVAFSAAPVFTDTSGPVYSPVIRVGVSEALDAETVTSGTVTLSSDKRAALPVSVAFESGLNQIVVTSRQVLATGRTYTLSIDPGVTDRAGNPLTGPVTLRFTTATSGAKIFLPAVAR
ncbi:MAG: right-handed parallel beta-helix repeat-containing protein [Chloroflexi bacterium]|nr:right-handed parallel beta-helix repeat-containing protein [Chloroflexota bacterium]